MLPWRVLTLGHNYFDIKGHWFFFCEWVKTFFFFFKVMLSLTRCRFCREFSGVSCKRLLVAVADWNDFKYDIYLKPAVQYGQTSGIDNIAKCAICELHICLLTIKKKTWVLIYCLFFFCFTSCFLLTFSQQLLNVKKWQVRFVMIAQSSHAPFSTRSVL